MVNQSRRHYKIPKSVPGDAASFSYYVWLSQIQQGRCLKTSFEKGRRSKSTSNIKNMGSVVW